MTRVERFAKQEAHAKAALKNLEARLAAATHKRLAEEKRQQRKRQALVGRMADEAGLLALSDTDLAGLFAALTPLLQVPNPGAVLEALLSDTETLAHIDGNGCADLRSCGPYGASLDTVH